MPCYSPLRGFKGRGGAFVFQRREAILPVPFSVPCGQCIGCRLERSRQWAVRCMHEAQLHEDNSFITLTYSPEKMPDGGTLVLHHFQDFMKRLRSRLSPRKIRFFHCGEYGEKLGRPHYHACIFGYGFPDRKHFKDVNDQALFVSAFLSSVWGFGFCTLGSLTFESAAYVARYCCKKVTGDLAHDHYWRVNEDTGECFQVEPEYATMSRRPGIGSGWFEKFGSEVYPSDEVIVGGRRCKPPRFYDSLYEVESPADYEAVKRKRMVAARAHAEDQTDSRLLVRERVKRAQVSMLKRGYEDEA